MVDSQSMATSEMVERDIDVASVIVLDPCFRWMAVLRILKNWTPSSNCFQNRKPTSEFSPPDRYEVEDVAERHYSSIKSDVEYATMMAVR